MRTFARAVVLSIMSGLLGMSVQAGSGRVTPKMRVHLLSDQSTASSFENNGPSKSSPAENTTPVNPMTDARVPAVVREAMDLRSRHSGFSLGLAFLFFIVMTAGFLARRHFAARALEAEEW